MRAKPGQANDEAGSRVLAGAIAPANATKMFGINGLVAPIQTTHRRAAGRDRHAMERCADRRRQSAGSTARYRGRALPAGDSVYFSLDNGTPFNSFKDAGLYGVSVGRA